MTELTVASIERTSPAGIYYRLTSTPTSAETLVLVMGYGGSLRVWPTSFVESLAQQYRVITYDNRGTGKSFVPKTPEEYTIQAMSADLDELLQHAEAESIHLLGYSMGGCIALQHALDFSSRVRSLFLLSSTAGGTMFVKPDPAFSSQLANPAGNSLYEMYMSTFKLMYSEQEFRRCQPVFDAIFASAQNTPTPPIALRGHSHAFRAFDVSERLSELKIPVTVFAGQDDRLMPAGNSQHLAQAITGARLVLLPNCEHGAHVQEPDTVIAEILRLSGSASC